MFDVLTLSLSTFMSLFLFYFPLQLLRSKTRFDFDFNFEPRFENPQTTNPARSSPDHKYQGWLQQLQAQVLDGGGPGPDPWLYRGGLLHLISR